jgi:hypothetical protein
MTVAACAACALVGGGIAYGSIPDAHGRVNACFRTSGGVLRVIDTAAGGRCRRPAETALSWDQLGAHATAVSRAAGPVSVPAGTTGVVIVSARLAAGFYVVGAHTTIYTAPNQESACRLTFQSPSASSEFDADFSSETNIGSAQSLAKHSLEGVWQFGSTPVTVRLKCQAESTWQAASSALVVTRVSSASVVNVTTGDPVGL